MESKLMTPEAASRAYYQRHIDAESRAALRRELQYDYTGADFDGVTYYYRS